MLNLEKVGFLCQCQTSVISRSLEGLHLYMTWFCLGLGYFVFAPLGGFRPTRVTN